uniref:Uncharacterized protein n=1 Tax=Oryza brachyantha TaxID=4533 RepID=J3MSK6_ORYBR
MKTMARSFHFFMMKSPIYQNYILINLTSIMLRVWLHNIWKSGFLLIIMHALYRLLTPDQHFTCSCFSKCKTY